MDGEQNGTQVQQQDPQQEQQQQQMAQQPQQQAQQETGASSAGKPAGDSGGAPAGQFDSAAYEAQLAQRDSRIAELEAQVADAAKTAEAAEALRGELAELKAQGESDRIDFKLQLAGCRNVKAARAVLDDHKGDIDALKAAEPWMCRRCSAEADRQDRIAERGGRDRCGQADEGMARNRWAYRREIAPGKLRRLHNAQQHRILKAIHRYS